MTSAWLIRHRIRRYLRSSLYVAPVGAIFLAMLVAPVIRWIDFRTNWTLFGFSTSGASAVVAALSSSLLSLIVFAFSILLLAIQVAGGQLSPRIIARIFRVRLMKLTMATFVFSYTYSLAALSRIGERVPQLPVAVAVVSSLCSLGLFIFLFQKTGETFRPGTIMTLIAAETREVIQTMYPLPFSGTEVPHTEALLDTARPDRIVRQRKGWGVVLAFDAEGLLAMATRAGCIIELVPQVGDFLPPEDEVFRLYGEGAARVDEDRLLDCIDLGIERTMEQDPAFGFRIIADVAAKALSPAINDPTTGVLATDQLHHLLHLVAIRQLDTGIVSDAGGAVRLVYRTPDWEDFVTLAGTELRVYGASNPQVTRRLHAMYDHLLRVVPPARRPALEREMVLLDSTIAHAWPSLPDQAIAAAGDPQGLGSPRRG